MTPNLQYLSYIVRHKYHVFVAGVQLKVPLRQLIVHDWSKLLPDEWVPYRNWFYGDYRTILERNIAYEDFQLAWNKHQKRNKHHWQYWVVSNDNGGFEALEMPEKYVREMAADWIGAGKAISSDNDVLDYYVQHKEITILAPKTRRFFERLIGYWP